MLTYTVRQDDAEFQGAVTRLAALWEKEGHDVTRDQLEAALWRWFTLEAETLLTDAEWYTDSPHSSHARRFSRCLDSVRSLAPGGDRDAP